MTKEKTPFPLARMAAGLLLILPLTLLGGCSQDFESIDDVHVPQATDERFPITVVDMPVKMIVPAKPGRLPPGDVSRLASFAAVARQGTSSPVSVSYPAGSTAARGVSHQAVRVLLSNGVPRSRIKTASYEGKSDIVSLSFTHRVASTKPCGDWSTNLANNSQNLTYPDFGCSVQTNFAAMVKNPDDFERARALGPTYSKSRIPAVDKYQSGRWSDSSNAEAQSFGSIFD